MTGRKRHTGYTQFRHITKENGITKKLDGIDAGIQTEVDWKRKAFANLERDKEGASFG